MKEKRASKTSLFLYLLLLMCRVMKEVVGREEILVLPGVAIIAEHLLGHNAHLYHHLIVSSAA